MSVVYRLKKMMLQRSSLESEEGGDPRNALINSIGAFLSDDKLDLATLKQALAVQRARASARLVGLRLFLELLQALSNQGFILNSLSVLNQLNSALLLNAREVRP